MYSIRGFDRSQVDGSRAMGLTKVSSNMSLSDGNH